MPGLKKEQTKFIDALVKATHFSRPETEILLMMFFEYSKKKMERTKFRDVMHNMFCMTDDILLDRDCFEVYDLNSDGFISREEMFQMLKSSLIKQPHDEDPDEGIKDLVDVILKKMDCDHDGRLSYTDYKTSVKADNLLIEAFGPCLPTEEQVDALLVDIADKIYEGNL